MQYRYFLKTNKRLYSSGLVSTPEEHKAAEQEMNHLLRVKQNQDNSVEFVRWYVEDENGRLISQSNVLVELVEGR